MSQPTPRVLAEEELPVPPPGRRPRRASILVRTIGGFTRDEEVDGEAVAPVGVIPVIGGANGSDDRVADVGIIHVIGGANGRGDTPAGGR